MGSIYSKHHLLVSLALGVAVAALWPGVAPIGPVGPGVVAGAGLVGVLVDLDHLVIAWLNSGEPRALSYGLANPRVAFLDQSELFEDGEVSSHERLLSHVLIVGVAVPVGFWLAPLVGVTLAVVLYGHVLSDLVWEVHREQTKGNAPRQ